MSAIRRDQILPRPVGSRDLEPGTRLSYRGDEVAFVQGKNLIRQGAASGKYLLPFFTEIADDEGDVKRDWSSTPCSQGTEFEITNVERNRLGRNAQPLPDLVILRSKTFPNAQFGLNPLDVGAKFSLLSSAADLRDAAEEKMQIANRSTVLEELSAEGW